MAERYLTWLMKCLTKIVGYFNLKAIKTYKIKNIESEIKIARQKSLIKSKFYALMIGIDQYDEYPKLSTPINDIRVLGDI